MANHTVTDTTITVHGRGSLSLPFRLTDSNGATVDISSWAIRFEVDGVPISELLVADPGNATGKMIVLERAQVASLSKTPMAFAVIDERYSASDIYTVLWNGTIARTDYKDAPDTVVE